MVALKVGIAFFGIHGDATVVAHVFMGTRCKVEERCLATVGIAYQRHINGMTGRMLGIMGCAGHILRFRDVCSLVLILSHLNLLGLLTSQADLVAHDLVFHGVLQGSTLQHVHALPLDKAHFNDTLAEASVSLHLNNIRLVASLQV